jgi:hypothetical protein
MLGEGIQLRESLKAAGITPERKHPKIEKVPRTTGPCLVVYLGADGGIEGVEPVLADDKALARFWQFSLTNGSTFPVTRVRDPLMERGPASPEGAEKPPSAWHALCDEVTRATPRLAREKEATYYRSLFREGGEVMGLKGPLTGAPGAERVLEVIRRFEKAFPVAGGVANREAIAATLDALCRAVIARVETSNDETMVHAANMLLLDAASGGGKTVQLAFDLREATIYDTETRNVVIRTLLDAGEGGGDDAEGGTARTGICLLTGERTVLQSATFPKVRLPFIFEKGLPLFSMNTKEAECNSRYRRRDAELCPVAPGVALAIQDAYGYLLTDENRGKTWQSIPSEDPGAYDLLIAYLDSTVPEFDLHLADFLDRVEEFGTWQSEFEQQTYRVCDALKAKAGVDPTTPVALTVVRKASEGTGFVLFSAFPTVAEITTGARWWAGAMGNVPDIKIPVFPPRPAPGSDGATTAPPDKTPRRTGPLPVRPGDIVSLLTEAWTEAKGTAPEKGRANKLRGASYASALSLMVGHPYPQERAAQDLLAMVIEHAGPLLVRIGACQWRGDFSAFQNAERIKALRAVSLLGLTLKALDSEKEDFMHSPAFLIGRFLALADRLHYDYCMVVRDGQIPPGLVGNTAMATALKSPLRAFTVLSERMPVYIGWAKTAPADGNKHSRFAKAVLNEYRLVADELAQCLTRGELPETCSDCDRAHLLLGYLASTKTAKVEGQTDANPDAATAVTPDETLEGGETAPAHEEEN